MGKFVNSVSSDRVKPTAGTPTDSELKANKTLRMVGRFGGTPKYRDFIFYKNSTLQRWNSQKNEMKGSHRVWRVISFVKFY